MERKPGKSRELLQAAGYRWSADSDAWIDDRTHRELDGRIAQTLPTDELSAWLKAGEGRERF
ncbi:MAG TPA: hypothetical protein VKU61_11815 [Candidatus Binatia bacterium]|nr:hypothetical protein [Candidatus Binatia bacterium]